MDYMCFTFYMCVDVSDDEAPMDVEKDGHALVATEIMQASHVDGRSHGVVS